MLSVGLIFSFQITGQDIYSTATFAPPARTDLSQLAPLSSTATSQAGHNSSAASENNDEEEEEEDEEDVEEEEEEESSGEEEGDDDDDEDNEGGEVKEEDDDDEGENARTANDNDDDDENDPGASGHLDSDNEGGDVDPGIGFHRRQVRRANTVAVAATYAHRGRADHATHGGGGRGEIDGPPSSQLRGGTVRGAKLGIDNVVVANKSVRGTRTSIGGQNQCTA